VVDDDETFAEALADALRSEPGFEVAAVANGVRCGLEHADEQVDVALVDFKMPEGGGLEFVRQLSSRLPDVAVVAMSGSWNDTSRSSMLLAGAWAIIDKAAAIDEICSVVRSARDSRSVDGSEQA
jgi:DNA-binding NarL/FixJ family response regulator